MNLTFSVIKLAKFATNPNNEHIEAITLVFNYLKKTKDKSLNYYKFNKNNNSFINSYYNANYTRNIINIIIVTNKVIIIFIKFIII